jgi:hypothetical protein
MTWNKGELGSQGLSASGLGPMGVPPPSVSGERAEPRTVYLLVGLSYLFSTILVPYNAYIGICSTSQCHEKLMKLIHLKKCRGCRFFLKETEVRDFRPPLFPTKVATLDPHSYHNFFQNCFQTCGTI